MASAGAVRSAVPCWSGGVLWCATVQRRLPRDLRRFCIFFHPDRSMCGVTERKRPGVVWGWITTFRSSQAKAWLLCNVQDTSLKTAIAVHCALSFEMRQIAAERISTFVYRGEQIHYN